MTLYTDFVNQCKALTFLSLPDHALLGHAMGTVTAVNEFECQLKCIENYSCKSVNVHADAQKTLRRELLPGFGIIFSELAA